APRHDVHGRAPQPARPRPPPSDRCRASPATAGSAGGADRTRGRTTVSEAVSPRWRPGRHAQQEPMAPGAPGREICRRAWGGGGGWPTKGRGPGAAGGGNVAGARGGGGAPPRGGRARDARAMIEVEYKPLPAVIDLEQALEEGAPLVHADLGTNLCVEVSGR